jgi:chemotaxis-related protein WspD
VEHQFEVAPTRATRAHDACWSRIGVRGDRSCKELQLHVHCRNCPVYSEAARGLLDYEATPAYVSEWTRHYSQPKTLKGSIGDAAEGEALAIIIFRVCREWLALPARVVMEVTELRPIHSLPHRRGVVLGLTNIRGELLPCLSLGQVLSVQQPGELDRSAASGQPDGRLLVTRRGDARIVFPVDHVEGIHRINAKDRQNLPATIARDSNTYSKAIVTWRNKSVGLLDDERLFTALRRSLA